MHTSQCLDVQNASKPTRQQRELAEIRITGIQVAISILSLNRLTGDLVDISHAFCYLKSPDFYGNLTSSQLSTWSIEHPVVFFIESMKKQQVLNNASLHRDEGSGSKGAPVCGTPTSHGPISDLETGGVPFSKGQTKINFLNIKLLGLLPKF